jgi:hypothetical protein
LQIVCGALITGCLTFTVVALGLVSSGSMPEVGTAPLLSYIGAGFAFALVVSRTVVPEMITARGRRAIAEGTWDQWQNRAVASDPRNVELIERTGDAGRLMGLYATRSIIGMAILEGGCFMNLVFFLVEQQYLPLGVAGALLAILVMGFPTHDRTVTWIEQQLRDMGERGHLER